jgi:hypothetical protein
MRVLSSRWSFGGCAATLVLGSLLGACANIGDLLLSQSRSPFALFQRTDMRAGLPYEVIVETANKESSQPLECLPLWAKAKRCAVRIEPGVLAAIVDSAGRVIRLIVTLDDRVRGGQDSHGQLVMRDALDEMQEAWNKIGPMSREGSDEATPQRRWFALHGRWGASMFYPPPRGMSGVVQAGRRDNDLAIMLPDSIVVTDLPAYSLLMHLQPPVPTLPPRRQPPPPQPPVLTPEQIVAAMRADLRELTIRQESVMHGTGRYETVLDHLGFVSTTGVRFALVNPTPEGWSAVATHPSLPKTSCVVYAGLVANRPRTQRSGLTGAPGEVICDSP